MGEPTLTPEEREAIRRRADVVRPLLRSISAWPWQSVRVEEEGFPCIPHPHFDFYQESTEVEVVESRPGYLHAKADWNTPTRCINVGCYLGKEADADFIVSAPEMIRMLRDDVWSLLSTLTAAEQRLEAAERALFWFAKYPEWVHDPEYLDRVCADLDAWRSLSSREENPDGEP